MATSDLMPGSYAAIQAGNTAPSQAYGAVNTTQQPVQPPTVNPNPPVPNGGINVSTPSPTNIPTTNPTAPVTQAWQIGSYDQRANLAGQYGIQNYTGTADQNTQLLQKYQAGLANAKASGQTPPTSTGDASKAVQDMTGVTTAQQQQQQAGIDQAKSITNTLQNDPGFAQLLQDQKDYLSTQNQQESFTQQYQDLSASLGLPALNTQLINMKAVMDGTEGDIRNEIQAAGGFGTESQVQALASARNKVLSQNYNNLLLTRDNAMNQINTMIGLAKEDRANAQALAQEKMNFDQQIIQYTQKFQQNALDGYNNIIKSVGYTGLFHSLNPGDIPLVEKTLGLQPGQLQLLATQEVAHNQAATQKDALQNQLLQAQIANTQANTAKTRADINMSNGSTTVPIQTGNGTVNAPAVLSPYIQTAYDGIAYADLSSLSPTDKAKMAQVASQAGIKPILTSGEAGKLNAISVSKTNLNNIQNSLSSLLNDKQTPFIQGLENSAKSFLGNADIKSFNAWRTAVINNVQALAGGEGSGLRINQAEIDTALKNDLPVLTGTGADNLSTALAKIQKLNSQMDVWTKQLLGGGNTASTNAGSTSQAGYIPPIGTVITSGGKSYHVIDAQGNLQPI